MSLEAVQKVTESEQRAQQRKAEAVEAAKKLVADADKAGREQVRAARAEAEAKVKAMMGEAEATGARRMEAVLDETRKSCDALRRGARDKLPDAAALIIRRVVGV